MRHPASLHHPARGAGIPQNGLGQDAPATSSTWGSGEAFEEDIDGDQDAVFLADEVSGMDVVHADSGGDVLEDGGGRWAVVWG
jgi:hypothetical protein